MLFNSLEFIIFIAVFFILYWFVFQKNLTLQNLFILVSSYIFYGWWNWKFLFLIIFITLFSWFIGLQISNSNNNIKRKWLNFINISVNIGILFVFKYFNFFIDSFSIFLSQLGYQSSISTLQIILPVGISFYTFQALSYSIDVYRKNIEPNKNLLTYSSYLAFFPQLVAGPIERATQLLPQFTKTRIFNYENANIGLKIILWGLVKKIVIADNCAVFANESFANFHNVNSLTLILGAIFFAIQIYGDFSGYTDIAIGVAKLFGFELMQNFKFPYFSSSFSEFWKRWHISLTSWFRDYLYIPLGGNRGNLLFVLRNTFIVFLISGLWHGANFTFIVWGFLNFLFLVPEIVFKTQISNFKLHSSFLIFIKTIFTFCCITFCWIFFRANSISDALIYVSNIFTKKLLVVPQFKDLFSFLLILVFVFVFILIEFLQRNKKYVLEFSNSNKYIVWIIYIFISLLIIYATPNTKFEFIYFQF